MLFEINDNWKIELEKLNSPYYLAIWLCEPQIIRSEVVCAIGDRIEIYSNHWFDHSEKDQIIRSAAYGKNKDRLDQFNWERKNMYDTHEAIDFDLSNFTDQRVYNRIKRTSLKIKDRSYGKTYYQRIGDTWVGREK